MKKITPFFAFFLLTLSLLWTGCRSAHNSQTTAPRVADATWNSLELSQDDINPQFAYSHPLRWEPRRRSNPQSTADLSIDIIESVQEDQTPYVPEVSATKYTVKKGESLWLIAKKNNVPLEDLMTYNGLTKYSVLKVGQELLIPREIHVSATPSIETETYTVVRGQTLSAIALVAGMSVEELKNLNHLNSTTIYAGQKLQLPLGTTSKMPAIKQEKAPASRLSGTTYKVQPGDTLSGIAIKTGVSMAKIMELNSISDPKKLRAGQNLILEEVRKEGLENLMVLEEKVSNPIQEDAPVVLETQVEIPEDESMFDNNSQAPIVPVEVI